MVTVSNYSIWSTIDTPKIETIGGLSYLMPPPTPEHRWESEAINRWCYESTGSKWWFSHQSGLTQDGQDYYPDLAGWQIPQGHSPQDIVLDRPPEWACEVVCEFDQTAIDRDWFLKRDYYASWGINHYWLVEPTAQRITVLELQGTTYQQIAVKEGKVRAHLSPFTDFQPLNLSWIWL